MADEQKPKKSSSLLKRIYLKVAEQPPYYLDSSNDTDDGEEKEK